MAIIASDIKTVLSGGTANTSPLTALGGAASTAAGGIIVSGVANNLFDNVTGAETSAGVTEYRCIYIHNTHATLTLQGASVYISANTPSSTTNCQIGLGTAALNGIEQLVASELVAPSGITFSNAAGSANALVIGDMLPGETRSLWVVRVVNAGTVAANGDGITIGVAGDTAA